MRPSISRGCLVLAVTVGVLNVAASGRSSRPCIPVEQAAQLFNKDICISAHVYDVVELADGTRFLDVCSPQTPDEQCRFTLVSYRQDRDEVGDLRKFRDTDVQLRGTVMPLRGRSGLVVSHSRQFNGGPPKFRPNPRLARGFGGDEERAPLNDPNLRRQGGARGFMNRKDRETISPQ